MANSLFPDQRFKFHFVLWLLLWCIIGMSDFHGFFPKQILATVWSSRIVEKNDNFIEIFVNWEGQLKIILYLLQDSGFKCLMIYRTGLHQFQASLILGKYAHSGTSTSILCSRNAYRDYYFRCSYNREE